MNGTASHLIFAPQKSCLKVSNNRVARNLRPTSPFDKLKARYDIFCLFKSSRKQSSSNPLVSLFTTFTCGGGRIFSLHERYRLQISLRLSINSRLVTIYSAFSNPHVSKVVCLLSSPCSLRSLAEAGGFEPPRGVNPCRISNAVPSTTQPRLLQDSI